MNLKKLDEFGLIDRITKDIRTDRSVIVGVGDDAAVLEYNKTEYLLLTCDMLVEDVDFRIDYSRPEQIGWKAVCCSVSDVAAMAGIPRWMVTSVAIPRHLGLDIIDGVYTGMKNAAKSFGINIVGGDTSHSEKLVIDVTMLGVVKKKNLIKRSGAKVGDAIFVTGTLGGAVRSGRHLGFTPRIKEAQALVENFRINSMIDISDGLSSDLRHILSMSRVGAVIKEALLPLSQGASVSDALTEGEDFELLFTVSEKEAKRLEKGFARPMRITRIGEIVGRSEAFKLIDESGSARQIKQEGYNHFA
jgi:thiamine-monophosphate kinase